MKKVTNAEAEGTLANRAPTSAQAYAINGNVVKYVFTGRISELIQAYNAVIKILYPKFPWYLFPGYLTYALYERYINYFKDKYRLEPIPNKLYHRLIRHEFIQSEHIIFVPEHLYYKYVDTPELNYVYMNISGGGSNGKSVSATGELSKNAADENPEKLIQQILNHAPRKILVRLLPVHDCPRNCVFAQENLYANLTEYFGRANDTTLSRSRFWIEFEAMGEDDSIPALATRAHVHLLNLPYDLPTEISDLILGNYFNEPRILHRGHVYRIELNRHLLTTPHYADHFHIFAYLRHVFFRCVLLEVHNKKGEPHAVVAKKLTELVQIPHKFQYVPRQYMDDFAIRLNYPSGLRRPYELLRSSIDAFIPRKSSCLSSKQIHPVFLLRGSPGSGKMKLADAVAADLGLHVYHECCSEIMSQIPSHTEAKLRATFAKSLASQPLLITLDNFELFGVDHEGNVDIRVLNAMQVEIDELYKIDRKHPVIILALSNEKKLNPVIQRLFLETISIDEPGKEERYEILRHLHIRELFVQKVFNMNEIKLLPLFPLEAQDYYMARLCFDWTQTKKTLYEIAEKTQGFILGDLEMLHDKTCADFFTRDRCRTPLKFEHFEKYLKEMQKAFADSFGAAKVPTVHWDDIGGLAKIKDEIQSSFGMPLKHIHLVGNEFRRSGIMLYGPPGTGKTLVAKAVATECNLCFLSVQGPELLNMYVGQSEKNVREIFDRARQAAPCVLFLDELDSLAPNRGVAGDSGGVMDRVVSQLLAEMDSVGDATKPIFILAATNRPDLIDPALLRPGRFDKMFYVGPCSTAEDKLSVLHAQTKKFNFGENVSLEEIAQELKDEMSGADLFSICSNAWLAGVRRLIDRHKKGKIPASDLTADNVIVELEDFRRAYDKYIPSISKEDLNYFKNLKKQYS